jgi:hypothetical protein
MPTATVVAALAPPRMRLRREIAGIMRPFTRKLSIIMHRIWIGGTNFRCSADKPSRVSGGAAYLAWL